MAETATKKAYGSEGSVQAALRDLFPLPSYALLPSVADATGFEKGRTIDALVMSCWPSRGIALYGIEIKVSRSDWLRELKNPAKAEAVCRYCDGFYVVAGEVGIVKDGELPETWGLIEPKGDKLAITTRAPRLDCEPIPREFLASILRSAAEGSQRGIRDQVEAASAKAFEAGRLAAPGLDTGKVKQLTDRLNELSKSVREFEDASGLPVSSPWEGGRTLGEKVKLLRAGFLNSVPAAIDDAERLGKRLIDEAKRYRDAVAKAAEIEASA